MTTIVTHTSPDWDAIAGCWLLQRYGGMADAAVAFVNTGNPDRDVLTTADAVMDTGGVYDAERRRFDHHQFADARASATCATALVGDWLGSACPAALTPLLRLVTAGDTGQRTAGADWSRMVGIHALLSAQKARRAADSALLAYGYAILDDLAAHLLARASAAATLATHTVYVSPDGLVIALDGAPQGATFAAFEDGARLVVFSSTLPGSVAVGVMRGGESQEPHAGRVVERAELATTDATLRAELARWFRHPAGFFAGRGTAKAPDPTPLAASFVDICAALDAAWER